jgi:hypothetical protein
MEPSFFSPLLPLFIRKKFLSFCGKGLWPFECLLDDIEKPEKFRFSLGRLLFGDGDEPWNKVVMFEVSVVAFWKATSRLLIRKEEKEGVIES